MQAVTHPYIKTVIQSSGLPYEQIAPLVNGSLQGQELIEYANRLQNELLNQANFKCRSYDTSSKRFKLKAPCIRDEILMEIFRRALSQNPLVIIKAAEQAEGVRFYPNFKRIVYIDLPRGLGSIAQSRLTKGVILITVCILGFIALLRFYVAIERHVAHLTLYLLRKSPLRIVKIANQIEKIRRWVWYHTNALFLPFFVAVSIINILPFHWMRDRANRAYFLVISLLIHNDPVSFIADQVTSVLPIVNECCNFLSEMGYASSLRAQTEKKSIEHARALAAWKSRWIGACLH